MKRLVALGCAWSCAVAAAAAPSQSQSLPSPPPPPPLPVPAVLPIAPAAQNVAATTDDSARISVPVTLGEQTWHFLIDTASTRSVIASDVADSLGLAAGRALQILTIAGVDAVPSVVIPELGFTTFAVRDIDAPSLARANLGGDGLLGLDVLRNNRLSIDFRGGTSLTIAPSSSKPSPAERHDDPDMIVVTARSRMGELIVTDADIDGIPVAVIIDTGSQDSIGNPALARMLFGSGYRYSQRMPQGSVKLISVTGRTLPADYAVVGKLLISGVSIENVPMAFGDVATFRQFGLIRRPAILLGMQTLRLFARVTIDFPRHQIRLLLRHSGSDAL